MEDWVCGARKRSSADDVACALLSFEFDCVVDSEDTSCEYILDEGPDSALGLLSLEPPPHAAREIVAASKVNKDVRCRLFR